MSLHVRWADGVGDVEMVVSAKQGREGRPAANREEAGAGRSGPTRSNAVQLLVDAITGSAHVPVDECFRAVRRASVVLTFTDRAGYPCVDQNAQVTSRGNLYLPLATNSVPPWPQKDHLHSANSESWRAGDDASATAVAIAGRPLRQKAQRSSPARPALLGEAESTRVNRRAPRPRAAIRCPAPSRACRHRTRERSAAVAPRIPNARAPGARAH